MRSLGTHDVFLAAVDSGEVCGGCLAAGAGGNGREVGDGGFSVEVGEEECGKVAEDEAGKFLARSEGKQLSSDTSSEVITNFIACQANSTL